MPFLKDDEFFLHMDIAAAGDYDPLRYPLMPNKFYTHRTLDELKSLREVGVQTTMPFQCIRKEIETSPGVYDWKYLDDYVNQAFKAEMKTILFTTTCGYPDWLPDEYFVKCADGVHREALSPWNDEAMCDDITFTKKIMGRYSSKNCLIANSQLSVGETILLNIPAFYDDKAIQSFREFTDSEDSPEPNEGRTEAWLLDSYQKLLVRQQRVLATNQFKEIFVMLHPAIADMGFYGNGCKWIPDILGELRRQIPGVTINHIYYTWIQWPQYWPIMNEFRERYKENVFGGAEYTEGLPVTAPIAIENGLRGQIVAPCYPGIHDHIEPWMLENLRVAQKQWEDSRK
jgi:hypothetical protein